MQKKLKLWNHNGGMFARLNQHQCSPTRHNQAQKWHAHPPWVCLPTSCASQVYSRQDVVFYKDPTRNAVMVISPCCNKK